MIHWTQLNTSPWKPQNYGSLIFLIKTSSNSIKKSNINLFPFFLYAWDKGRAAFTTDLRLHWGKPRCSGFLLLFLGKEKTLSMSAAHLLTLQTARSEVSHKQLFVLISTIIFHQSESSDVKRYLRMENNSALEPSELISASKQGYAQCKFSHSSTWKVSHTQIFLCFQQREGKGGRRGDTHTTYLKAKFFPACP